MRKVYPYLFFAMILISSFQAKATVHTVSVFASFFSPILVSAVVGDTVKWIWTGGVHTTSSTQVPANAPPWDSPITSTVTEYSYPLSQPGSYFYKCTPHGFLGQIIVAPATGINSPKILDELSIYPVRPSIFNISYTLKNSTEIKISVFDITGRSVKVFATEYIRSGEYKGTLNFEDLQGGIYVVQFSAGNQRFAKRIIIE
jgi:plastocyanin